MSLGTLLGKLRIATLSNLNTLLDRVIDLNSIGAVEQYVRDLEASASKVDEAVTDAIANGRLYQKEKLQKTSRATQLEKVIRDILGDDDPSNDAAATPKAKELAGIRTRLGELEELITANIEAKTGIEQALAALNSRTEEMKARLERLRSTDSTAKAKEEAAAALKMARGHLESGPGGQSVDSALQRAQARGEQANVGLERELERTKDAAGNPEVDQAVSDILSEFRPAKTEKRTAAGGKR